MKIQVALLFFIKLSDYKLMKFRSIIVEWLRIDSREQPFNRSPSGKQMHLYISEFFPQSIYVFFFCFI